MSSSTAVAEEHFINRQRTFVATGRTTIAVVAEIIRALSSERATGKVTVNLSQGSICSIHFEERARLRTDPQ